MALVTDVESRKTRRKQERQSRKKRKKQQKQLEASEQEEAVDKPALKKPKKARRDKEKTTNNDDPYAHLDAETAAAMRRDDAEIAELEEKLGVSDEKEKGKLYREFAKGYGDEFGDFLDDLDGLVHRVTHNTDDKEGSDHPIPFKKKPEKSKKDPYAHLDAETAAAMRRDDEEIAVLEAKLGLGSRKDRKRLYREYAKLEGYGDDFGEFLDSLDDIGRQDVQLEQDDGEFPTDSSEDEEEVPMKEPFEPMDEDDSLVDDLKHFQAEGSDEGSDSESSSNGNISARNRADEESDTLPSADEPDHDIQDTYRPSKGQDIYGNVVNAQGCDPVPTMYVPPHMRKKQGQDMNNDDEDENRVETLRLLQRALNNSLNRLSDDTLISVALSLAKLYPSYPTPDVNDKLWTNVLNACVSRPIVMSGMVPVYTACLAGVHFQTSDNVQLGGFLLEQVITKLWQELDVIRVRDPSDATGEDIASKEACNLMLMLCYLYNFGVAHSLLMYDVVRNLIQHFTEVDVELLLLILSHCGHALRSDDPSALKEIVLLVQKKALEEQQSGESQSSRVEYMVSAMTDLKNNKKRRQDQAFGEKTIKLKKLLGRIKSTVAANGTGRSSDACLRMTLQDILNVESKGRWWKVGACWVGNQYKHKDEDSDGEEPSMQLAKESTRESTEEAEILKLASSQRMNTDTRRSIFCIIMGSEDCDDAFEKLVRAGMLKNRTERDTVRVLTECCGNEKTFNPFYAHLASRICDYQQQCKFTFQLSFWDTFKQFDSLKPRRVANLAKLLFHLVAVHHSLRLNVLKVIDMSPNNMSDTASIFLTIFFSRIFDTFEDPVDVVRLFPQSHPDVAMGNKMLMDDTNDGNEALREGLSVFFLQTLKSSPKNKKGSKFRKNFKAAVKACATDGM